MSKYKSALLLGAVSLVFVASSYAMNEQCEDRNKQMKVHFLLPSFLVDEIDIDNSEQNKTSNTNCHRDELEELYRKIYAVTEQLNEAYLNGQKNTAMILEQQQTFLYGQLSWLENYSVQESSQSEAKTDRMATVLETSLSSFSLKHEDNTKNENDNIKSGDSESEQTNESNQNNNNNQQSPTNLVIEENENIQTSPKKRKVVVVNPNSRIHKFNPGSRYGDLVQLREEIENAEQALKNALSRNDTANAALIEQQLHYLRLQLRELNKQTDLYDGQQKKEKEAQKLQLIKFEEEKKKKELLLLEQKRKEEEERQKEQYEKNKKQMEKNKLKAQISELKRRANEIQKECVRLSQITKKTIDENESTDTDSIDVLIANAEAGLKQQKLEAERKVQGNGHVKKMVRQHFKEVSDKLQSLKNQAARDIQSIVATQSQLKAELDAAQQQLNDLLDRLSSISDSLNLPPNAKNIPNSDEGLDELNFSIEQCNEQVKLLRKNINAITNAVDENTKRANSQKKKIESDCNMLLDHKKTKQLIEQQLSLRNSRIADLIPNDLRSGALEFADKLFFSGAQEYSSDFEEVLALIAGYAKLTGTKKKETKKRILDLVLKNPELMHDIIRNYESTRDYAAPIMGVPSDHSGLIEEKELIEWLIKKLEEKGLIQKGSLTIPPLQSAQPNASGQMTPRGGHGGRGGRGSSGARGGRGGRGRGAH